MNLCITWNCLNDKTTMGLCDKMLSHYRDSYGRDLGYRDENSRKTVIEYETDTGRTKRIQTSGAWFTYYFLAGTDLKSRLQYGGSGSAYYTYEPNRDLLTQVQNYINGGVISQYDYTNDALGRRTAITRSGSMMSETRADYYSYNDRNELILAIKNTEDTEYQYSYDDIGNRLSSLDLGTNRTYTANALNQYSSISNSALSATSREIFTPSFDLDGNQTLIRTATGDWTVTYNGENRPVNWYCGATNIVMKFDRMGRRVEYVETVNGVTNTHHRFVYEITAAQAGRAQRALQAERTERSDEVPREPRYLCVQRLNARSGNAIELSFAWDPTEPVATRPLVLQRQGGWNFFYTHDGNKNVSDVVSFQQARGVPAHYEYAPFGAVTAATKATTITAFDVRTLNPFRFSSEYADDTLGLVYYNYRHYDAVYGRWMCRDMDATNKNEKYLFLSNSSVHAFDMLGLRISEARCNEILNSLWDGVNRVGLDMEVVALNENITYWGCENPKPRCMCSIAAKRSGGFNPDDNTIEINTYYSSESSVRTTLLHELQHRLDWCVNGKEMPLGCDELGYWEVRAELRGGRCGSVDNPARPIDWDCVRRNALKSTEKHAQCEITAGKAVDRGIERMKNQGGRP